MNKLLVTGLASSILGLGLLTTVNAADPKPEDVVKYRQSVYTIIGWNFKPIGAMVKGEVPFDAAAVARHAQYVELMSQAAPEGFTKGSGPDAVKNTEAKPDIWTNMDDFRSKFAGLGEAAAGASEAVKGGAENVGPVVGKLGAACKACHDVYREKS